MKAKLILILSGSLLTLISLLKFTVWDKYSVYKDSDINKINKSLEDKTKSLHICDSTKTYISSSLELQEKLTDTLQMRYRDVLNELSVMKREESSAAKYLEKLQKNNLIDTVKIYVQVKEAWIGKKKKYITVNPKEVIDIQ